MTQIYIGLNSAEQNAREITVAGKSEEQIVWMSNAVTDLKARNTSQAAVELTHNYDLLEQDKQRFQAQGDKKSAHIAMVAQTGTADAMVYFALYHDIVTAKKNGRTYIEVGDFNEYKAKVHADARNLTSDIDAYRAAVAMAEENVQAAKNVEAQKAEIEVRLPHAKALQEIPAWRQDAVEAVITNAGKAEPKIRNADEAAVNLHNQIVETPAPWYHFGYDNRVKAMEVLEREKVIEAKQVAHAQAKALAAVAEKASPKLAAVGPVIAAAPVVAAMAPAAAAMPVEQVTKTAPSVEQVAKATPATEQAAKTTSVVEQTGKAIPVAAPKPTAIAEVAPLALKTFGPPAASSIMTQAASLPTAKPLSSLMPPLSEVMAANPAIAQSIAPWASGHTAAAKPEAAKVEVQPAKVEEQPAAEVKTAVKPAQAPAHRWTHIDKSIQFDLETLGLPTRHGERFDPSKGVEGMDGKKGTVTTGSIKKFLKDNNLTCFDDDAKDQLHAQADNKRSAHTQAAAAVREQKTPAPVSHFVWESHPVPDATPPVSTNASPLRVQRH